MIYEGGSQPFRSSREIVSNGFTVEPSFVGAARVGLSIRGKARALKRYQLPQVGLQQKYIYLLKYEEDILDPIFRVVLLLVEFSGGAWIRKVFRSCNSTHSWRMNSAIGGGMMIRRRPKSGLP